MHIVHIITRLIVGGAQENTLLSCEGQHRAGHRVTLLTGPALGPEGSLMDRARNAGYAVEVIESMRRAILPAKDLESYRVLLRRLRGLRADVVHTHSSKAGILGRWAAYHASVPLVVHTIHGLAFTASTNAVVNTSYRLAERVTAPITDRIVCVADAMREQSLRAGIGKPAQYVTVYSGMDVEPFLHPPVPREQTRAALGIAPDEVVVGMIARLFYLKGHEDLLALAPTLCREFPKLKFMWVGDGLLRRQFERRIDAAGLRRRFVLTGLVPPTRVPELTSAMDILVHPSRREGLARALPQGQLAGCPVVTYDIDGNREGLIDGQTGFLVRPFDVGKLSEHLRVLLSDADRRKAMGDAGRVFARSRFSARVMVDALQAVYESGLAAKRRRRGTDHVES